MKFPSISLCGLTLSVLVVALPFTQTMASAQTSAQSLSPSAENERQGATTGLGESHRFRSAAAAANHCPGDTIVWLSGSKLVYLLPGAAKYGEGSGAYACRMEADSAGFRNGGS